MTRFKTDAGEQVVATRDAEGRLWIDVRPASGPTRRYGPLDASPASGGRAPGQALEAVDVVVARTAGKVTRLHVEAGASVTQGQALLVMELMKMEVEVSAPRDGVLAAVSVSPGDVVARGAVMLRYET